MYTYNVSLDRVVDGDTIDVFVDLGFFIMKKVRVRLLGVDAPETRTKDIEMKKAGIRAKEFVQVYLSQNPESIEMKLVSKKLDSFGRALGHIYVNGEDLSEILIKHGHAKPF
jgi:micrococcal nuclease